MNACKFQVYTVGTFDSSTFQNIWGLVWKTLAPLFSLDMIHRKVVNAEYSMIRQQWRQKWVK